MPSFPDYAPLGIAALAIGIAAGAALFYFAQRRLRERGAVLRVMLESVGDAVIVTDALARITYFNPVAEELTAWSAAAAGGLPLDAVLEIVDGGSGLPVGNPAREAMRRKAVFWLPSRSLLTARGGATRPIDGSAMPVRDADGPISGCVVVFRELATPRVRQAQ